MKPPRTRPTLLFRLVVPATVIFILTVLALIASLFGDPDAPVARWLDTHGNQLLLWEFVGVIVLSFLAMAVDRWRTLRGIDEVPFQQSMGSDAANPRSSTSDASNSSVETS